MKRIFTLIAVFFLLVSVSKAQQCDNITWETNPTTVTDENAEIVLTATLDCSSIAWTTGDLYIWMWDDVSGTYPNGDWDASDSQMQMTDNGNGTYSFTFTPTTLNGGSTGITDIGFLVKALDGTGDNKTTDQHILFSSGINDISNNFVISPNPSTGLFNLSKKANFEVMNIAGKIVLKGSNNSINLTGFASGMYFAKISTVEGTTIKKLIVK